MASTVSRLAIATTIAFAFHAQTAFAEDAGADGGSVKPLTKVEAERDKALGDDPHDRGNILVTAQGLEELDIIAGQTVLGQAEIQRNLNGQIGEVLAKVPGVSATGFAPGASRPILRGLDGERVRVLIDGIGTADVGNTSADHATTVEPLLAQRVEVLRGPAALLFGSQSIGGVVNVIDKRIPVEMPEKDFHLDALVSADTANDLVSGGASLDIGLGPSFVLHLDGSYRDTGDVDIPGFQLAPDFRADLLADAAEEEAEGELEEAEEIREAANQEGRLPNSGTQTYSFNGGLGVILGDSTFGFSVGYYDTDYGLIGRPGAEHHHGEEEGGEEEEGEEEEIVTIGLEQVRGDFRADIGIGDGFFNRLKARAGYSDYTHTEFEGPEVGTVFDTKTFETRIELAQRDGGIVGLQFTSRDFEAVGEEAFVPANDTTSFAIFTVQEATFGNIQIEGAARYEKVDVESQPLNVERDFDLFSGAGSLVYSPLDDVRLGITASRSERAPAGEELFANGPHIATQTFEMGDADLDTESAWGLEAFARGQIGAVQFGISAYRQWFDNFIFLQGTGEEEDELPVFTFLQQDADFFGVEADVKFPIIDQDNFALISDLRASFIDAEFDDNTNVPRIPPTTLYAALEAQTESFDVRGEVQWFGEQDEVAAFETPTDDFAFVNAFVTYRPFGNNKNVTLQVSAENIFDTTGRRHASFTKDFVPLAGRNFRASVRMSF